MTLTQKDFCGISWDGKCFVYVFNKPEGGFEMKTFLTKQHPESLGELRYMCEISENGVEYWKTATDDNLINGKFV